MSEAQCTIIHCGFHADPETGVCYRTLDFLGFPGYRVGDDGSVWGCRKQKSFGYGGGSIGVVGNIWRKLSNNVNKWSGRHSILIRRAGESIRMSVHRLVLEAFVGPCPLGMEACHFPDRNPANNVVDNLKWGTHTENMGHKVFHGTNNDGERHGNSKLTADQVIEIRSLHRIGGITQKEIGKKFGVDQTCISGIVRGKSWDHIKC